MTIPPIIIFNTAFPVWFQRVAATPTPNHQHIECCLSQRWCRVSSFYRVALVQMKQHLHYDNNSPQLSTQKFLRYGKIGRAKRFRRLAKAKKDMALMIPYLKNREFKNLADAPEINADGKFIITPQRPEWSTWRKYLQQKYGDSAVKRLDERKSFFADLRWPEIASA